MTDPGRPTQDPGGAPLGYVLGRGLLARLGELAAAVVPPGRCAVVTDAGVDGAGFASTACEALAAAGYRPAKIVVPQGEDAKTVAEAARTWERFAAEGMERGSPVFALGGGAVGDLAGFVAATWHRGVPLIQVPTTLLAMADSAVGGKAAVNLAGGKNLVGAFHLPALVVADLDVLGALPEREVRSGLAEVAKCALLTARSALAVLEADVTALAARDPEALARAVRLAVRVKVEHVRGDLRESGGSRVLLNLGHTTAHAVETCAGHGAWRHGEAVAVGLVVAARIAEARGLCEAGLPARVASLLSALGLPTALPPEIPPDEIAAVSLRDKKTAAGRRRMVLPVKDGGAVVETVPDEELVHALVS